MGPTSSGKTTIAKKFMSEISKTNHTFIHYDGDEVRIFWEKFWLSRKNRNKVIEILVYLSQKANLSGVSTIVSALTAYKSSRDYINKNIININSVYIKCPIEICEKRDPKVI